MSTHSVNGGDPAALCLPDTPSISPSSPLLAGGRPQDAVSSSPPLLASRASDSTVAERAKPYSGMGCTDRLCTIPFLDLEIGQTARAVVQRIIVRASRTPAGVPDDRVCWFPDFDLGITVPQFTAVSSASGSSYVLAPNAVKVPTLAPAKSRSASDELKQALQAASRAGVYVRVRSPGRRNGTNVGERDHGGHFVIETRRQIESLWLASALTNDRVAALEAGPKHPRVKQKFGGRGVKKDNDYWLDRWERDVVHEVKDEGYAHKEGMCEMKVRVYRLGSERAAQAINDRYRKENRGKNVVSASSLRRRHPSTTITNARGEVVRIKGAFVSKRWGQWEPYRNGEEVVDSLAEGSTKMECSEENDGSDKPAPTASAGRVVAMHAAAREDEDRRKRSLFDGGLETATVQDLAKAAVASGELGFHEGGQGIHHVRPPRDEVEFRENRDEEMADEYFRTLGLNPHAVHKPLEDDQSESVD